MQSITMQRWMIFWFVGLWAAQAHAAERLTIGVAANFVTTLEQLAGLFEQRTQTKVRISAGASGTLYAQIQNGAPFDLYLAADADRPRALVEGGFGLPNTLATYAVGRLSLCVHGQSPQLESLTRPSIRHIAVPNPDLAPYGQAALDTLANRQIDVQQKLITVQNVSQAFALFFSRNTQAAFVAEAQVRSKQLDTCQLIDSELHAPIQQDLVQMTKAQAPQLAQAFRDFLLGNEARSVIQAAGYVTP